jgi:hypothetical protein
MTSLVPTGKRELVDFAMTTVEQCRVSAGQRAAECRKMNAIAETGRYDGSKALINMMNAHLERSAAHLFSPVELKFTVDFENKYPKFEMERAAVAGTLLTRHWERANVDILFGRGVFEALKYGWCGMKQWSQTHGAEGRDQRITYHEKLVMPWQFGVYNEAENDINAQHALCETTLQTMPQIWRRICLLPGAEKLFERIRAHAQTGASMSEMSNTFHQVLSTSQLNTGLSGSTSPMPGGIVQLGNEPNFSMMGPQVSAPVVQVHEIWVQDGKDYTTILLIEPDIIVSPLIIGEGAIQTSNLLIQNSGLQPYRAIQPNEVTNWFWGRSEMVDLIEPQSLLSTMCEDSKRLMGLQVDKLLGFTGENGMTDEMYANARLAGYFNLTQGSDIKDLTPKFPPELQPFIQWLITEINELGSFPEIMQGKGEPGVRAGTHADTLLKTASPTLRDRSLIVERQCAMHADLTLDIRSAKDHHNYWTDGTSASKADETKFTLSQLPEDSRVTVDSHSSSPIFANENEQLIWAALKAGVVDDEYVLSNLNFPNREAAILAARERKVQKAQFTQQLLRDYPEVGEKVALKSLTGGKQH